MNKFSRLALVAAAGTMAITLAACSAGGSAAEPSDEGSATAPLLTLGQFVEPTSFDPAAAQEGNYLPYYQAVYDTLILREADGSLAPMLATEWSWNEDLTILTLTLRDDVTFSDGAVFDAEAAKANIEHFIATPGPSANQASSIASVEAVDATTLEISLDAPDPALEFSLANALGLMGSPDALGTDTIAAEPVGSGPYTLDTAETLVGSEYTYVRNEDYWGEALPFDEIKFMVLTDETARVNALRSGQIDAGVFTAPATFQELEAAGLTVQSQTVDWSGFVYFDRTGALNPAFEDERVREAITLSIDKEALVEQVALGRGELTSQIFPTSSLSYNEAFDDDANFAYDPEKAKELLAEAGYEDGLTIDMPISPVFDPAIYTAIEQNLSDVGITMERVEYGPGQTLPAVFSGKHAIMYMTLAMFNDWTTIRQYVAADAPWNPLHTEDPELTALIEEFQNAASDEDRTAAGQEINQWLVDSNWYGVFSRAFATYANDADVEVELQVQQAVPSIYNYSPAN
ncbi:ABC transporter substrate-binding protein [Microbacterium sp. NPDC056569]|uniref:ABC transporter substrate-binding protein n=1 Tax=Microbacterium sp. NPDC056569 TaxID=3345867 RepID=UPI00366E6039